MGCVAGAAELCGGEPAGAGRAVPGRAGARGPGAGALAQRVAAGAGVVRARRPARRRRRPGAARAPPAAHAAALQPGPHSALARHRKYLMLGFVAFSLILHRKLRSVQAESSMESSR